MVAISQPFIDGLRLQPLYLHVSGMTQEILDRAVAEIERLIEQAQMPVPEIDRRSSGPRACTMASLNSGIC